MLGDSQQVKGKRTKLPHPVATLRGVGYRLKRPNKSALDERSL